MRLKQHLPKRGQRGGRWESHRRVINGILFRQRTEVPWRDLPARFGKWKAVYERHRRWSADGMWDRIFKAVLGRHGRDGLHRLVDGERGFNVLPCSPERRRSTQEATPGSGKTDARQHLPMRGSDAPRAG